MKKQISEKRMYKNFGRVGYGFCEPKLKETKSKIFFEIGSENDSRCN